MSNESEVARLLKQIELEAQAMQQALNGPAITARHDFIAHRYDSIGGLHEELIPLVGEEQATGLMYDSYRRGMEGM